VAVLFEMNKEVWNEWVDSRPDVIKNICKKYPPDRLYLLKTTNRRVTIHSYSENGTVTVDVSGDYNIVTFARRVFGVNPEDLQECDLPSKNEECFAVLEKREDIDKYIQSMRQRRQNKGA
jgi:hypothetical protein